MVVVIMGSGMMIEGGGSDGRWCSYVLDNFS